MTDALTGPISPGEREWFPAEDWDADSYIYDGKREAWLALMIAARPGTGALSRLMKEIWASGRTVIVPCPLYQMRSILEAKGFLPVDKDPCLIFARGP
ncbi:hypothetical protein FHS82_001003 [Pseudochelatococcus lubricantis]|uniref:N-acetyltransferase n=1 Tax=Pseudochelatococcus lubricantis TaxID=1538102 RepID=A0ABX0UWP2_9HYPH|nr:hypothetical protein [Pseudochelatococcus lubricantis]